MKEALVPYILYMGILGGIGGAFIWLSNDMYNFDFSNPKNRFKWGVAHQTIKGTINATLPLLIGAIIVSFVGGYMIVFTLAAVAYFSSFLSTFFISKNKILKCRDNYYHFFKVSKELLSYKDFRLNMLSQVLRSVSYTYKYLFPFMILFITNSEFKIGFYKFLNLGVGLIFSLMLYKHIANKDYNWILKLSGLANLIGMVSLIFYQSYAFLLIYGFINGLTHISDKVTFTKSRNLLDTIFKSRDKRIKVRTEFIALYEQFHYIGKIIGFSLLFLLTEPIDKFRLAVLLISTGLLHTTGLFILSKIETI